jgi:hypothetical protein
MNNSYKVLSASLFLVMIKGTTTSGAFSSAYADSDNDKNNGDNVKVDCVDVAISLAALNIALRALDEDQIEGSVEATLEEAEISGSLDDIQENFQNVLDEVNDECEDVDYIGFVESEERD